MIASLGCSILAIISLLVGDLTAMQIWCAAAVVCWNGVIGHLAARELARHDHAAPNDHDCAPAPDRVA